MQVIPHITDEIKRKVIEGAGKSQVAIVEIGGTVGDIESQPFLEAIRQMKLQLGQERTLFIHLTLVPYLVSAGETKTKPTQHSVKEMLSHGLQPDILICRSDNVMSDEDKENLNIYFHNIFNIEFNQENYFYLDKHPNNLGHKKIGENLYNILKTNLLIN